MSEAGQLMMWGLGWIAVVPDADTSTATSTVATSARERRAVAAAAIRRALRGSRSSLPDGPERTALFDRMNDLIVAYAPWILTDYPYDNVARAAVGQGLQAQHPIPAHQWWFYDVAAH